MYIAEQEEQQNRVEVSLLDTRRWRVGLEVEGEMVEGGEEVVGDEESLVWEREGVEAVEGEREEDGRGEERGEAEVLVVGVGEDGVGEI